MVWTLNSGRARGGPFNTRNCHHHGPEYRIAIDAYNPLLCLPAQQGPSKQHPNVLFGSYFYMPALEEWWWDESSVSRDRVRPGSGDAAKSQDGLAR